MKLIAMALGSVSTCGLCQVLAAHGGTTPEAVREFNEMRERNGYRGKPAHGDEWIALLQQHEDHHKRLGETLPEAWTEKGIPLAFYEAYKPVERPVAKPVYVKRELSEEEKAIQEFKAWARPVVKQRNGRADNKPIVRPLETKPFAGL